MTIFRTVREHMKGRTVVVVAHDMRSVMDADYIIAQPGGLHLVRGGGAQTDAPAVRLIDALEQLEQGSPAGSASGWPSPGRC